MSQCSTTAGALEPRPEVPYRRVDITAPILFLARGHSGTALLARLLESGGVYVGNRGDAGCLNDTYDSLHWTFGFQRELVPRLFEWGVGCRVDEAVTVAAAEGCLQRHLPPRTSGQWGFKTCAAMFAHPLYRRVFPNARYIYLIRDGRDVTLSGGGVLHLTNPSARLRDWEYFKIITFGISDDIDSCPFEFPGKPEDDDEIMRNKYWIQAKSWREHVRMVDHLRQAGQLSPHVHTIRYEELCADPIAVLEQLFDFLELEMTEDVRAAARRMVHARSTQRWKAYMLQGGERARYMETVFAGMEPELARLGYGS